MLEDDEHCKTVKLDLERCGRDRIDQHNVSRDTGVNPANTINGQAHKKGKAIKKHPSLATKSFPTKQACFEPVIVRPDWMGSAIPPLSDSSPWLTSVMQKRSLTAEPAGEKCNSVIGTRYLRHFPQAKKRMAPSGLLESNGVVQNVSPS